MWLLWRGDAADHGGQVAYEALVNAALGHTLGLVGVDDLAGDASVPELGPGPRQGVHIDHELVAVLGAFLAVLHVGDEDLVVIQHQQSGLPARVAEWPRRRKLFWSSMRIS